MLKARYKTEINKFLLGFENWNVKGKVTGITLRKKIRNQIPDEAVRRMSMHQEYADERDCIEALRQAVRDEKDFQEGKSLKYKISRGQTLVGKGNMRRQQRRGQQKNLSIPLKREGYTRRRKRRTRCRKETWHHCRKSSIQFGPPHILVSTRK